MKANQKKTLNRLKRIRGQIDGIIKMVENDKYCLDISTQLMAVSAAIKSTNKEVLIAHLQSCVSDTLKQKEDFDVEEKINEIEDVIIKLSK